MRDLHLHSQGRVGDAQVVGLDVALESVQFLVEDIEAKETHFWDGDTLLLLLVSVAVLVTVAVLVLVRGMSILEWKEFSTCHRAGSSPVRFSFVFAKNFGNFTSHFFTVVAARFLSVQNGDFNRTQRYLNRNPPIDLGIHAQTLLKLH